jgi:GDPmannose 4,6-dehydratase
VYEDPHKPGARLFLHYGDLCSGEQLTNLIYDVQPNEIYHLGAQSHVRVSFDIPEYTGDTTGLGTTRIYGGDPAQAESRPGFTRRALPKCLEVHPLPKMMGTPLRPRSPYGSAKVYAYWMTRNYRDAYGLFACKRHFVQSRESTSRRHICHPQNYRAIGANPVRQTKKKLYLGNLDAKRDWGYAPEYIEAMWLMLQQDHSTTM